MESNMKTVIIAGGTPPSLPLLKEEMRDCSVIICADSGANCMYDYGIMPQYLIGDFDSISKTALDYFMSSKCIVETFPKDKDYTDIELALLKAMELESDTIAFLGCLGSRADHSFANFGLLLKCINNNIKGYIRNENNYIELLNSPSVILGKPEENFSMLAYNSPVTDLSLSGAKYPLTNYRLEIGDSLTVSNKFLNRRVEIRFSSGTLLLLRSFDL